MGLEIADKHDSQDICFVPQGKYADIIRKMHPEAVAQGEIVHLDGRVLGTHEGIVNYTIGQRKGLGAAGRPQYVVKIEPSLNRVVIGSDSDLLRTRFTVRDVNWIAVKGAPDRIPCQIQIRNRFEPQPGHVVQQDGQTIVEFETPQRAVTPGQGAVFYWDDVVVGGGWIAA